MLVFLSTSTPHEWHKILFSEEIKGRFRNRWAGVYFCPQREDINEICPALCPPGFNSLAEYSQSTCSHLDTEENKKYRLGR